MHWKNKAFLSSGWSTISGTTGLFVSSLAVLADHYWMWLKLAATGTTYHQEGVGKGNR
jgi:hypothetical protein